MFSVPPLKNLLFSQHTYTPHINTQFKKSCTELYSPLYRTLFSSSQYKTIIMINLSSPHITHKHQHFTTEIEENLRRSLNPRLRPKIIPPKKYRTIPSNTTFFSLYILRKWNPHLHFGMMSSSKGIDCLCYHRNRHYRET